VSEQVQRKPLPDHLPRDVQTFLPEAIGKCSKCGAPMKPLGEDVSEQLEYVPASFRVIHHVRSKFACSCCDHTAQAAAPSRPVERSLAGSGLLAHVLAWKFAESLSLYRHSVTYARDGVASVADIDRVVRDGVGLRWSVTGPFETVDLNTRGGIESHARKMGPAYERMGVSRGQHDPWTPELVARVASERRAELSLDDWDARVQWRDRRLMALIRDRRRMDI
jgi:transposase